jgi:RNA polymerase sigma-70 factor (ECF subfamily)
MHDTPASLLQRLRQPADTAAWTRFVELYTPLLYYWGRRAGLQESDAADLVQDVLTLLVRKLPDFEYNEHRSFRAWLRTVTLNKLRESKRRKSASLIGGGSELADVAGPDGMEAFEAVEYRRQLIHRALQTLRSEFPPTTWKAFGEYVLAGRNAAAVAAELNVRIGTVYAAKSRVLSRLREELDGLLD